MTIYETMDQINTAKDSPDDIQAIEFEKVSAGIEINLPETVLMENDSVVNQGKTLLCVAYWTTEWINESRKQLGFKWGKNPETLAGYIRTNLDPNIDKQGTYIINWPKWARKLWWLEWYSQVNTIEEMKKALAFGMTISTGTNKLSWAKTRSNNYIAVEGKWGWHFINIVWYDTENTLTWSDGIEHEWGYFIIENTWGKKWGDNWYYYLPFSYALKVLFNTKKALLIDELSNRKYADKFIENFKKELEEKKISPVINKYEYFDWEQLAISDQENRNLFIVLQNLIKESWYKPIFRTIIWSNEDRTNARILLEISHARAYERTIRK